VTRVTAAMRFPSTEELAGPTLEVSTPNTTPSAKPSDPRVPLVVTRSFRCRCQFLLPDVKRRSDDTVTGQLTASSYEVTMLRSHGRSRDVAPRATDGSLPRHLLRAGE
jgi:hypothetical protein